MGTPTIPTTPTPSSTPGSFATFIKTIAAILFLSGAILDYFVLGSPYATGAAGFVPSTLLYLLCWLTSIAMALLYLEAILTLPNGSNLLTLTETYWGRFAKRIMALFFLLFFVYPLLSHFFTFFYLLLFYEIAPLIGLHFSSYQIFLLFLIFFGLILFSGLTTTLIVNFLLSVGLFATNFFIVKNGASFVDPANFSMSHWSYLLASLPLLYFFRFQTTLPILSSFLQRRYKRLIFVIVMGILLPTLSLLAFNWLIIGTTSAQDLLFIFDSSQPLNKGLELVDKAPWYGPMAIYFGLFVVLNSFMINAYATLEILLDGFKIAPDQRRGLKRLLVLPLVLVPPLFLSFLFRDLVTDPLFLLLDFSDLVFSLFVLSTIWIIRYRLNLASSRLLFGGKSLLIFFFCLLFYVLWLHGIALLR